MALVTLRVAKLHLRVTANELDDDIKLKTEEATQIVLDYLKPAHVDTTWSEKTVPLVVQAAILAVVEASHEHRAIDWDAIGRLLMRLRDPALA